MSYDSKTKIYKFNLHTMKINIKDQEVKIRWTSRALVNYENISGKSMTDCTTYNDVLIMFYSFILGSTRNELQLTWNEFNDWLDDDYEKSIEEQRPSVQVEFSNWYINELERQNYLSANMEVVAEEEKKN